MHPQNSSRDPKVGPRAKQRKKKKVRAHSLICSISKVRGVLELRDGTKMNSQTKVQNDINLYNQNKKAINVNRMEVVWWT
jgi:hypothetical protein